ncbi:hypothetical protein Ddye_014998 [Dipteronia dyeriana]|uniref:Transcription repressor n=1 Tax=Dipteronia dyeriana TaxID=168575 RepID=A0AAD9U539_9ROSI|nr:hypothetical protein Ddye_014998 [Dipteronia dyeriana]
MGNYRFRLSDMMPNAWFYKLKDMGKARNHHATSTANAAAAASATQSVKKKQSKSAAMTHPTNPKQQSQQNSHQLYPRKSYYFTRELGGATDKFYNSPPKPKPTDTHFPVEPPRKSTKQRRLRRRPNRPPSGSGSGPKLVSSSVSAGCSCRATIWTHKAESPESPPPDYNSSSSASSSSSSPIVPELRSDRVLVTESFDDMVCSCRVIDSGNNNNNNAKDTVIDVKKKPDTTTKFDFDSLSELELPPIITKPLAKIIDEEDVVKYKKSSSKFQEKNVHGSLSVKVVKEERITTKQQHKTSSSPVKRIGGSMNSPGVKLRLNSPKIANKKLIQGRRSTSSSSSSSSRKSNLSDSFAIVKSSYDPQRDFRDSMVEMIVENNIRASKDLEDLLACYLSLNSDEYHELIINVFKQIWFDLTK